MHPIMMVDLVRGWTFIIPLTLFDAQTTARSI